MKKDARQIILKPKETAQTKVVRIYPNFQLHQNFNM
jgi:hypothetical protein